MIDEIFDYIIVGAGSSGCVLANRLSADGSKRVLLLEAGGENGSILFSMPKGFFMLLKDKSRCWLIPADHPKMPGIQPIETWIAGKVLGGSSSVNGMIYSRGHPHDYAEWERLANSNWGWPAMLEAYKRIEDHELGADEERGAGGPLHVSTGKFRYPIAEALIKAGEQMGLTRKEDLNRSNLDGVGYYCHTINNGRRVSAADAFLKPARRRKNLTVLTDVHVDRVTFDGRRVNGVVGRSQGRQVSFATRGEVIISAGTMLSPKILQLSGIGPGALLQSVGVPVVVDSPDVGSHLHDHVGFRMQYRLKGDKGTNYRFRGAGLLGSVLQYMLFNSGPMATGPFEVGAFVRSDPASTRPDAQLFLSGVTMSYAEDENHQLRALGIESKPGIGVYLQLINPTSEGSLRIKSADPDVMPAITPNFLTTDNDCRIAVAVARYVRRYMGKPALDGFVGEELMPTNQYESDADILDGFRRMSTLGVHAVGTCRMGNDRNSVVDEQLRVRGVEGLRVVDCSVMPSPVSGNTSGPAMALGWRAADLILAA